MGEPCCHPGYKKLTVLSQAARERICHESVCSSRCRTHPGMRPRPCSFPSSHKGGAYGETGWQSWGKHEP